MHLVAAIGANINQPAVTAIFSMQMPLLRHLLTGDTGGWLKRLGSTIETVAGVLLACRRRYTIFAL